MSRRAAAWALAAVVATTAVLHREALTGRFVLDDRDLARSRLTDGRPNLFVRGTVPFRRYWLSHYWASVEPADPQYRPVTVLSFAAVYRLAGQGAADAADEARPQRALNLFLHLTAVVVAYRLLRRVPLERSAALAGAALFAVHALHAEVLGGIVGRAELLAFVGGGSGVLACLSRGRLSLVLGALAFLVGAGAKEHAYLFPLGALLLRAPWRRTAAAAGPPLLLLACLWGWVLLHLPPLPPVSPLTNPLAPLGFPERLPPAFFVWAYGLSKVLCPQTLACDYSAVVFPSVPGWTDPRAWVGLAAWLGLAAVGLVRRAPRPLRLAALWYLLFTLPTANFLFPIGTVFAERLFYTPSWALALAGAFLVSRVPRAGGLVLLVALLYHGTLTTRRLPYWRDQTTLVLHDVKVQPRSARLHYLAAKEREQRGELEAMEEELRQATRLYPAWGLPWNDLGVLAARRGAWAEAGRAFRRGLAAPDTAARDRALLAVNLGQLLAVQSRPEEALRTLLLAVAMEPRRAADALAQQRGRLERLLGPARLRRLFQAGARRAPEDPRWRQWLAEGR